MRRRDLLIGTAAAAALTGALAGAQRLRRAAMLGRSAPRERVIRQAYRVYTGTPVSGGYASVARWQELHRRRMWIRNPADSPGSLRVGTRPAVTTNNYIDTTAIGTAVATLAPGQELLIENDQLCWLFTSDQPNGSVPANLYAHVEVEIAA